jgi:tetratricopeptide (TPR) repeat protein
MRVYGLVGALLITAAFATDADWDRAERLYNRTDFEGSLKVLLASPQKDGRAHHWIGRNYFMLGDYKKATEALLKSVQAAPQNSEYYHWLGKAWGRRAETSTPFTAPGYATKAREAFEKAVQLNPRNVEAANDLFEYYMQAPGFLGGGLDKAAALSTQIAAIDPVEGHYAKARLAEKRKEFSTAEQQFRRAVELAPQQVGRVVDLAKFLAKQGRIQESEQTFEQAEKIDPNHPQLLFQRAETYIREGRNIPAARALLKRYLQANLTPDDPPRSAAEKLLREASGG